MTFTSVMSALAAALSGLALPGGLIGIATIATVAGLLLVLFVCHVHGGIADPARSPGRLTAVGLRERSRRTARLRLRDPNTAGRTRSRAPGHGQAAA